MFASRLCSHLHPPAWTRLTTTGARIHLPSKQQLLADRTCSRSATKHHLPRAPWRLLLHVSSVARARPRAPGTRRSQGQRLSAARSGHPQARRRSRSSSRRLPPRPCGETRPEQRDGRRIRCRPQVPRPTVATFRSEQSSASPLICASPPCQRARRRSTAANQQHEEPLCTHERERRGLATPPSTAGAPRPSGSRHPAARP